MVKDINDGWKQAGRERSHTKTKGPISEKMAQAYQAELGPNRDTRNNGMETESERINEGTEVATQQSPAGESEQQRSNSELVEISTQEKEKHKYKTPKNQEKI
jgi:hypothetical protein